MLTESRTVEKTKIGLTDLAWQIAREEQAAHGCSSLSEYFEWVILCQRFPAAEAAALLKLRKQRGGLGGVRVVPDDAVLPEG